ncbi:MAG TPA: HAD family phosphatase [Draconibacterium sp.]|nr:HAD family phosphatase [Draconibacterium sp.]
MREVKAVIFDMDGVLVDTEPFHIQTEKRMFRKMGLDISDEEHAGYMGTATDVMWKQIISKRNLPLDIAEMTELTIQEGLPFFYSLKKIDPMPGLVDLLEKLSAKKIPMAVASSSDTEAIRVILVKSGLRKYFQHAVSSSEVGKSKPETDVFLHAAKLLEVAPENCVVFEDSKNGIKAAKAAGMFCIAYSNGDSGHQDQTQADRSIADYNEIDVETFLK